jgi:hypothetical protein
MGRLYEQVLRAERLIKVKNLPNFMTKGKIAIRAGFPLGMITPETPDDETRIMRLKAAIDEVMKES